MPFLFPVGADSTGIGTPQVERERPRTRHTQCTGDLGGHPVCDDTVPTGRAGRWPSSVAARSRRLRTPTLSKTALRWSWTVYWEMCTASTISRVEDPRTTSVAI